MGHRYQRGFGMFNSGSREKFLCCSFSLPGRQQHLAILEVDQIEGPRNRVSQGPVVQQIVEGRKCFVFSFDGGLDVFVLSFNLSLGDQRISSFQPEEIIARILRAEVASVAKRI